MKPCPSPFIAVLVMAHAGLGLTACSDSESGTTASSSSSGSLEPSPGWSIFIGTSYPDQSDGSIGPMSESLLRRQLSLGRFRPDTPVRSDSMDDWVDMNKAFSAVEFSGSLADGERWREIIAKGDGVDHPLIPDDREDDTLTSEEARAWLSEDLNQVLLDEMRAMGDRFGPMNPISSGGFSAGGELAQLLRYDMELAVLDGDDERAIQDMVAACTLSRQIHLALADANGWTDAHLDVGYFDWPDIYASRCLMRGVALPLVNLKDMEIASDLREEASEHLGWVPETTRSEIKERHARIKKERVEQPGRWREKDQDMHAVIVSVMIE